MPEHGWHEGGTGQAAVGMDGEVDMKRETLAVPWLFYGYSMAIPWLFHGYSLAVL